MSYILNIDTAVETASVCLAQDANPLILKSNPDPKDSAAWLHTAIKNILEEAELLLSQLDAIAISAGPGSYTGLRVGMATAKGFCYAQQIPLITINSLKMMAAAAQGADADLLCPMIDARRMEVFTAVFDQQLNEVRPSMNLVLDKQSFTELIEEKTVLFFGNGSTKFRSLVDHPHCKFQNIQSSASDLTKLSYQKFNNGDFASLAYTEPFYGKDFHSIIANS